MSMESRKYLQIITKPEAPGRYEIYPMYRVDIPEYFGGYLTWDFDERGNYVYRQFLHMCSEFLDEVEIPPGDPAGQLQWICYRKDLYPGVCYNFAG